MSRNGCSLLRDWIADSRFFVVVGTADDLTGQAVHAYVCMKEESDYSKAPEKEAELKKALGIQVRKVIGPFAAPKKIVSFVGVFPC